MSKTIEKPLHTVRFPGESPEYRVARDRLLTAELELRRQVEEVTALRRKLPLGGMVKEAYVFEEGDPDLDQPAGASGSGCRSCSGRGRRVSCSTASCTGRRWRSLVP